MLDNAFKLVLVLGAFVAQSHAVSYYVSPSGDDFSSGTSPDAAWRSLKHASSVRLSGSDSLLLERGGEWLDDTLALAFPEGLVSTYGNDSLPRPAIVYSRSALATDPVPCLKLYRPHGVSVEGVRFVGCGYGVSMTSPTNVVLSNLFFADIIAPFRTNSPAMPVWGTAVQLLDKGTNVTIQHCVATRVDSFLSSGLNVSDVKVVATTVAQCGGNCMALNGDRPSLQRSVFLRDTPREMFLYGTTDVIVGFSTNGSITQTDFYRRGEYESAPDGCAIDFETTAHGFQIADCGFYRSFGGGIMIFGHQETSTGVVIQNNVFDHAGCEQVAGDHGGIAVMCPDFHRPSGTVTGNTFVTCPGVGAISSPSIVPHCTSNLHIHANTIINGTSRADDVTGIVHTPHLRLAQVKPTSRAPTAVMPVLFTTTTPNATITYTVDGSRPEADSLTARPLLLDVIRAALARVSRDDETVRLRVPVHRAAEAAAADEDVDIPCHVLRDAVPADGSEVTVAACALSWPAPDLAVNARAFKPGWAPSATNGAVYERHAYAPRSVPPQRDLIGFIDGVGVSGAGAVVSGWALDRTLPRRGWLPVNVTVEVDFVPVVTVVANISRPDIVPIAPNPNHGFRAVVPLARMASAIRAHGMAVSSTFQLPGRHIISATVRGYELTGYQCLCDDQPCAC
eukprot:TRINITY_DN754_c0_g1_i1.p2 TRINITY_DN754_c0_g1~~TRINITY_DN754_c0_g1_i1.p2  ORF type:complete len:678 (-),score=118.23 TRINITY_DN754_c0_g1_i1:2684-4717(-)